MHTPNEREFIILLDVVRRSAEEMRSSQLVDDKEARSVQHRAPALAAALRMDARFNLPGKPTSASLLRALHLSFHHLAQCRIDARLISSAVLLEPGDHIGIQAQRDWLFQWTVEIRDPHRSHRKTFLRLR